MTGKQVTTIMFGSVLVIGGVLYFGKNRRKKLLFTAISDKINDVGGTYQGSGGLELGAPTTGCSLSALQTERLAKRLRSSQYGEWYLLGMGTDEEGIMSNMRSIPNRACLAKVSSAYLEIYGSNMDADLRNELSGDYLEEYEKIITNEIPA